MNELKNNGCEGIFLEYSSNNIISKNILIENKNGISLTCFSNYNIIDFNTISDQHFGIWIVLSSDNNIISNNSLSNNNWGIYLSSSINNSVTFNNLKFNKVNAFFINCKQLVWDCNYWNRPRLLPKPIFGLNKIYQKIWIPYINFDNNPVNKPFYEKLNE